MTTKEFWKIVQSRNISYYDNPHGDNEIIELLHDLFKNNGVNIERVNSPVILYKKKAINMSTIKITSVVDLDNYIAKLKESTKFLYYLSGTCKIQYQQGLVMNNLFVRGYIDYLEDDVVISETSSYS